MELTSQVGHPANEGIGDKLPDQFGIEVKIGCIKQATCQMIRYVMDEIEYILVQRSVKCRKKLKFMFLNRAMKSAKITLQYPLNKWFNYSFLNQ
jgi:hypothetical protein